MVSTPLAHLPLRPSTLTLLRQRGFSTWQEMEESKASGGMSNLAQELQLSLAEAAALVREVQTATTEASTSQNPRATALSILQSQSARSIISFSKSLDNMLGGGFSVGEFTELCGLPGAGKTQLAMQLCVNASLPQHVGGVSGSAVYIDTEGSFTPERCESMAIALVKHVQKSAKQGVPEWFTPDNILDNIHVFRVYDEATQMATLEYLPEFIAQQRARPIRLIVLDSIAFHYRGNTDFMERTRSISTAASLLGDLATKCEVATVVVNHMTTKVLGGDMSVVVPALGESWAHAVTTRLILEQQSPESSYRVCRLVKSPHKPNAEAFLDVRECGIRDVPRKVLAELENQEPKRQRTK